MFNDDAAINALMKWAALEHSVEAERQLELPWFKTTERRAHRAKAEATKLLAGRGVFLTGNLWLRARAAFKEHLKLRQELAEIDPTQLVSRSLFRAEAFTWAIEARRRAERD